MGQNINKKKILSSLISRDMIARMGLHKFSSYYNWPNFMFFFCLQHHKNKMPTVYVIQIVILSKPKYFMSDGN